MKTIYSLKDFHEKAVQISGKIPDHVSVNVGYGLFGKYTFTCYADGYSAYTGDTMEESLKKMQDAIAPVIQNLDVEIDIPEPQIIEP